MKIYFKQRLGNWLAWMADEPDKYAQGRSEIAAVGALISKYFGRFDVPSVAKIGFAQDFIEDIERSEDAKFLREIQQYIKDKEGPVQVFMWLRKKPSTWTETDYPTVLGDFAFGHQKLFKVRIQRRQNMRVVAE